MGQAGPRVGYVVGPPSITTAVRRIAMIWSTTCRVCCSGPCCGRGRAPRPARRVMYRQARRSTCPARGLPRPDAEASVLELVAGRAGRAAPWSELAAAGIAVLGVGEEDARRACYSAVRLTRLEGGRATWPRCLLMPTRRRVRTSLDHLVGDSAVVWPLRFLASAIVSGTPLFVAAAALVSKSSAAL